MLAGKLVGAGSVGLTQIGIWLLCRRGHFCSHRHRLRLRETSAASHGWMRAVPGILSARLPAFQRAALCVGSPHRAKRSRNCKMYMPGRRTYMAQLCHDHAHRPTDSNVLVDRGFAFSAYRAHRHVPPHGIADAPAWQFAVSIGLLVLSIWGTRWSVAAFIGLGILMYGKRLRCRSWLRWLRTARMDVTTEQKFTLSQRLVRPWCRRVVWALCGS